MTFISYSQNFEDLMLWRVFKDLSNGFYVDVGANDPLVDSVTKTFYDAGWSGINIEPLTQHIEDLREHRSRDINLEYAISDEEGTATIWESERRGWATLSWDVADEHRRKGFCITDKQVKVKTLTQVLSQYAYDQEIHFLKIDVEGFEERVLRGLDLSRFRAWVLIIESTLPNSQVESYQAWEQILISNNYDFVYFDGLNRFYVARERRSFVGKSFDFPPCVFDDAIKYEFYRDKVYLDKTKQSYLNEKWHLDLMTERCNLLEGQLRNCVSELQVAKQELQVAKQELQIIKGSLVWRAYMRIRIFLKRENFFYKP